MDFFLKIYKNRPAAGASAYNTIELGHSAQQIGHSARQTKPFSNKKILTFGSNPFLEKYCLRACSCHYMLRFFWRHNAYIVTYAGNDSK